MVSFFVYILDNMYGGEALGESLFMRDGEEQGSWYLEGTSLSHVGGSSFYVSKADNGWLLLSDTRVLVKSCMWPKEIW